jgi:nucleoside-diphosphate-sugar epimerase
VRVVIVGATGNAGTALIDELERAEVADEIVGLARRPAPLRPGWTATRFEVADIVRDDLVGAFRGADAVVHLAWFFQPTHRPDVTWVNNVGGSERVFAAVATARVPTLVYASSVGAYSSAPGRVVDESWPTHSHPGPAYGREKAYVERLLDRFECERPEVRVVRMRPAFLFTEAAASEQRRIFAGPFVPNLLARRVPVLPYPAGLRMQALRTEDAAVAYRLAIESDARGAFNLAADPVLDGPTLAGALGARLITVPPIVVRAALAAAWHARLVPAEPALFDLVLQIPELDATRARRELGWTPRSSSVDAVLALLWGISEGSGGATAPLTPDGWRSRTDELRRGVGSRVG